MMIAVVMVMVTNAAMTCSSGFSPSYQNITGFFAVTCCRNGVIQPSGGCISHDHSDYGSLCASIFPGINCNCGPSSTGQVISNGGRCTGVCIRAGACCTLKSPCTNLSETIPTRPTRSYSPWPTLPPPPPTHTPTITETPTENSSIRFSGNPLLDLLSIVSILFVIL